MITPHVLVLIAESLYADGVAPARLASVTAVVSDAVLVQPLDAETLRPVGLPETLPLIAVTPILTNDGRRPATLDDWRHDR